MIEVLREKFLITERRGGAIYKTKSLGMEWVPMDSVAGRMGTVGDFSYAPPSTSYEGQTIRTVKQASRDKD